MLHIGVREFRDHATRYLSGGEMLAVERHGRPIGFYIPIRPVPNEERRRAVAQLSKAVERLLAESGMTEDELVGILDLNNNDSVESVLTASQASGH